MHTCLDGVVLYGWDAFTFPFFEYAHNTTLAPHTSNYNVNPMFSWMHNLIDIVSPWWQLSAQHVAAYSNSKFKPMNTFAKSTRNRWRLCPSKVNSFLTPKYASRAWLKVSFPRLCNRKSTIEQMKHDKKPEILLLHPLPLSRGVKVKQSNVTLLARHTPMASIGSNFTTLNTNTASVCGIKYANQPVGSSAVLCICFSLSGLVWDLGCLRHGLHKKHELNTRSSQWHMAQSHNYTRLTLEIKRQK